MKNIAIIDYRMSNMFSIKNALDYLGYKNIITSNPLEIKKADAAILPGVGSFPKAMEQLQKLKLKDVIQDIVYDEKPIMGICLGLQLLFTSSSENYDCEGLNIIDGKVENLSDHMTQGTVPHIGWNKTKVKTYSKNDISELDILLKNNFFYFVHSYFVIPKNKESVYTETCIGDFKFCSSIKQKNILGLQFHPEKSGLKGLWIFKHFFK